MAASSTQTLPSPAGMADRLRRAREDRFGDNLPSRMDAATRRGMANPFGPAEARLGDTCASFCRPLSKVTCCCMDLNGLVNLLLFLQVLYGVLLVIVHTLILLPPFNLPQVDAFPAANKWLPLLDLQYGYRIEAGDNKGWEEDFIDADGGAEVQESFYLGTVMGVVIGIITIIFAVATTTRRQCCPIRGTGHRTLEKSWLVFTFGLLGWFCLCNLGKVPTRAVCFFADAGNATEVIASPKTIVHETESAAQASMSGASELTPAKDMDHTSSCDAFRLFFVQWTLMVTLIIGLLLWAALSSINKSILSYERVPSRERDDETTD